MRLLPPVSGRHDYHDKTIDCTVTDAKEVQEFTFEVWDAEEEKRAKEN